METTDKFYIYETL